MCRGQPFDTKVKPGPSSSTLRLDMADRGAGGIHGPSLMTFLGRAILTCNKDMLKYLLGGAHRASQWGWVVIRSACACLSCGVFHLQQ